MAVVTYTDGSIEWIYKEKVVMYKSPDGAYFRYHEEDDPIDYTVQTSVGRSVYYRNGVIEIYSNNGELLKRVDPNAVCINKKTWAQIVSG